MKRLAERLVGWAAGRFGWPEWRVGSLPLAAGDDPARRRRMLRRLERKLKQTGVISR